MPSGRSKGTPQQGLDSSHAGKRSCRRKRSAPGGLSKQWHVRQVCQEAALRLREEVSRKSRAAIVLRRWRQMLAQVLIVAAFAPGLNVPVAKHAPV